MERDACRKFIGHICLIVADTDSVEAPSMEEEGMSSHFRLGIPFGICSSMHTVRKLTLMWNVRRAEEYAVQNSERCHCTDSLRSNANLMFYCLKFSILQVYRLLFHLHSVLYHVELYKHLSQYWRCLFSTLLLDSWEEHSSDDTQVMGFAPPSSLHSGSWSNGIHVEELDNSHWPYGKALWTEGKWCTPCRGKKRPQYSRHNFDKFR